MLSHKNWGTSSTLLNELARDTYDYDKFAVITQLMWESIENERPAAWRVVFKGLSLLEHLIKNGSERCVDDARGHNHVLRKLLQFNYYEGTIDRGLGVREKTKQLLDVLSDDERIREERQKARKLREKFGGSSGGVGGGGGGGGGAGGQYAGYGNDNWDRDSGGSGGYGDGGIGSNKASGRYDSDERPGGYSGRYNNEATVGTTSAAVAPTFATLSDDVAPKKTKGKKKKKETATTTESGVGDVDLFSFDDPVSGAPTTAMTGTTDDDFDTFQSAVPSGTGSTNVSAMDDPFGGSDNFVSAAPVVASSSTQFDAFSSAAPTVTPVQTTSQFNALPNHGANIMSGGSNNTMMQQQQPQIPGMGHNAMMGFNNPNAGGFSGMQQLPKQQQFQSAPDDDFGDFAAASTAPAVNHVGMVSNASKPLDKLISLDGLSKNKAGSLEDKLNQPIIANAAAATFVQEKEHIQAAVQQSVKGSTMSFAGIDGLHKSSMTMPSSMNPSMMMMMPPPSNYMGTMNPSVMGGSGGTSSSMIGMLDPNEMMGKKPAVPAVTPQQPGMMMNNSTAGMMPGMTAGGNNMMMNPMAGNNMMMQQPMGMNNMGMMNTMPMQQQQFGGNTMMNPGFGMSSGIPQHQGMGISMQQGNMGMSAGQNWNGSGGMGQQQPNSGMGGQPPMGGFR